VSVWKFNRFYRAELETDTAPFTAHRVNAITEPAFCVLGELNRGKAAKPFAQATLDAGVHHDTRLVSADKIVC
jgi:hypothetical protein